MKSIQQFRHKKILVLGLAKSGVSAATLLHKLGAFVTVNDQKPLEENPQAQSLLKDGVKVICGHHPISLMDEGFEWVVKNPGIPYHNPLVQKAIAKGVPILTEIELAYLVSEAPIVAITGTNGKTTTTTLIDSLLTAGGFSSKIAGNIGTVASDVARKVTKDDWMVVECSSFQLKGTDQFRPRVSVLLNLYEAHLDYHETIDDYWESKGRITSQQTAEDVLVYNADQAAVQKIVDRTKAQLVPFSTTKEVSTGAYVKDGALWVQEEHILSTEEVALPGEHNLENVLASIAVAKYVGVSTDAIRDVLKTFTGVQHRLQFVGNVKGRLVYNDSKATNNLATQKALQSFQQPIVWLAGGLDRGQSFDELLTSLTHVKSLICFGETKGKLASLGKRAGIKAINLVDNVEKAVDEAFLQSQPGDVILLSPACASWDQYRTFEVRGDMFIKAVHKVE